MRIGIEINGVLRNTLKKIQQEYEKWYIDNPFLDENIEGEFKREVMCDLASLDIRTSLKFVDDEELYNFLYTEHPMEIFGHASSTEMSTFQDFNDFYTEFRDKFDIIIVSDEMGKSKPSSLFFLSKFGCLVESIKFYSQVTIKSMWDSVDILLTANPSLLLNHPEGKFVIKYETPYNKEIESQHTITKIKDLKNIIENYGSSIK